jgi:integrase
VTFDSTVPRPEPESQEPACNVVPLRRADEKPPEPRSDAELAACREFGRALAYAMPTDAALESIRVAARNMEDPANREMMGTPDGIATAHMLAAFGAETFARKDAEERGSRAATATANAVAAKLASANAPSAEYTSRDALADYRAHKATQGKADASLDQIDQKIDALLRHLPERLADVTYEWSCAYIERRSKTPVVVGRKRTPVAGRFIRPTTIRKELHGTLKPALVLARRRGKYALDPDVVIPELDDDYEPGKRWLMPLEFVGLSVVLKPHHMAQIAFAAAVGCDLCAIPRAMRVDVRRDLHGARVRGTKRDTRDRFVPTPLPEQQALLRFAVDNADGKDGVLFAAWPSLDQALGKACRSLRVEHASANDLRRTYSTWLRRAGVRPDLIAVGMGHKDGRQLGADDAIMVQRVYGRIDDDDEMLFALMRKQIEEMEAARATVPLTDRSEEDSLRRRDSNPDKRNQNPLSCR